MGVLHLSGSIIYCHGVDVYANRAARSRTESFRLLSSLFCPHGRRNRRDTATVTLNMPGLLLGDVFPDFEAESTTGNIKLHEFLGDS